MDKRSRRRARRHGQAGRRQRCDLGERPREREPATAGRRRDVLHGGPVAARPPGVGGRARRPGRHPARRRAAADPARGRRDAHGHVRGQPRGRLRPAHPLAVRDRLRRRGAPDRVLGGGDGDVRPADRACRSPGTVRAGRTRRWPTSVRPFGPAFPPSSSRTTGSSCSTGRPTSRSSSAASSRRPRRRASTPAAIGGPVEVPEELRDAALQRAMAFEREGTARV